MTWKATKGDHAWAGHIHRSGSGVSGKWLALFRPQRVGGISEIYHSLGPCARLAGTMERKKGAEEWI